MKEKIIIWEKQCRSFGSAQDDKVLKNGSAPASGRAGRMTICIGSTVIAVSGDTFFPERAW